MSQFQYTAVNNAGKKLTGVIGAADEGEARSKLNTFGISILNIQKVGDLRGSAPQAGNLITYEFEAFDSKNRKVQGTIPAANRYRAFTRLMDEYKFEVSYVVKQGATPEEREKAKGEDLSALKTQYAESSSGTAAPEATKVEDESFAILKQELLTKVDGILEKIRNLLKTYEQDLKPENKKLVQDYVDKLLRIKSSTNLEYIEETSMELLRKVQDQELFLHKEKMEQARDKLRFESQKMMADLHSNPKASLNLTEQAEKVQESMSHSKVPLLKGLAQLLRRWLPTAEIRDLKKKIAEANKQWFTLFKIWLQAPKSNKAEARLSLQKVREEKNRLQAKIKEIHRQERKQKTDEKVEPLITEEIRQFLGWLMAFYLLAYFLSYYLLAKAFPGGNPLPWDFNLLQSGMLRSLLVSIFLWYILLHMRLEYFRYKKGSNALLIPTGITLNFVLLLNL